MRCWGALKALLLLESVSCFNRPLSARRRASWQSLVVQSEPSGSDVPTMPSAAASPPPPSQSPPSSDAGGSSEGQQQQARPPPAPRGPPGGRPPYNGGGGGGGGGRPPYGGGGQQQQQQQQGGRPPYNSGGGGGGRPPYGGGGGDRQPFNGGPRRDGPGGGQRPPFPPSERTSVLQLTNAMVLVEKDRPRRRPPGDSPGGRGGRGGFSPGGRGGGPPGMRGPPGSMGQRNMNDGPMMPREGAGPGPRPGKPAPAFFGRNLDRLPGKKSYERPKRMDERSMQFRGARGTLKRKKNRDGQNKEKVRIVEKPVIIGGEPVAVQTLAKLLDKSGTDVVKYLMLKMGVLASLTQNVDAATARAVAEGLGKRWVASEDDINNDDDDDEDDDQDAYDEFFSVDGTAMERGSAFVSDEDESLLEPRAPVVTIMGHVDHGKTSLLDAIRSTRVTDKEQGGITQAIGAYTVETDSGKTITFIDTPGHSAFTEMRQRGANVTDIVILVVAADDGVKEQTVDSIACAKAARVPIIVAVNKVDVEGAEPERVETDLCTYDLVPESMGGETVFARVSAKEKTGLNELLESLLLQAEIMDLRANPTADAAGSVVEAGTRQGLGVVATCLIQRGTLKIGDIFVAGAAWGRCRAIQDDAGGSLTEAKPSQAVQIIGWQSGVDHMPVAGDSFAVVADENIARRVAGARQDIANLQRAAKIRASNIGGLASFFQGEGFQEEREVTVLIKADTAGAVEALTSSLDRLDVQDEVSRVRAKVVYGGVGDITKSDLAIASVSNAFVLAFNVAATVGALEEEKKLNQKIRYYGVIYAALEDIENKMRKVLSPTPDGELVGSATVKQLFDIGKLGRVAGCGVLSGYIKRSANVRVMKGDEIKYQGTLRTLRNVKTDVPRVDEGQDCGLSFKDWEEVEVGDIVECYDESV